MNTVLNESAVIELMRQEHTRASAEAEELWERLKTIEEAMAPQKAAYEAALHEWSDANRMAAALGALLKAKEPQAEVVHHLDGDESNHAPANLRVQKAGRREHGSKTN